MTKSSGTVLDGDPRPEGTRRMHRAGGQEPVLGQRAQHDSPARWGAETVPRNLRSSILAAAAAVICFCPHDGKAQTAASASPGPPASARVRSQPRLCPSPRR